MNTLRALFFGDQISARKIISYLSSTFSQTNLITLETPESSHVALERASDA